MHTGRTMRRRGYKSLNKTITLLSKKCFFNLSQFFICTTIQPFSEDTDTTIFLAHFVSSPVLNLIYDNFTWFVYRSSRRCHTRRWCRSSSRSSVISTCSWTMTKLRVPNGDLNPDGSPKRVGQMLRQHRLAQKSSPTRSGIKLILFLFVIFQSTERWQ